MACELGLSNQNKSWAYPIKTSQRALLGHRDRNILAFGTGWWCRTARNPEPGNHRGSTNSGAKPTEKGPGRASGKQSALTMPSLKLCFPWLHEIYSKRNKSPWFYRLVGILLLSDVCMRRILTMRQVRERERYEEKEKERRRKLREGRKGQTEKHARKRGRRMRIIEQFGGI